MDAVRGCLTWLLIVILAVLFIAAMVKVFTGGEDYKVDLIYVMVLFISLQMNILIGMVKAIEEGKKKEE